MPCQEHLIQQRSLGTWSGDALTLTHAIELLKTTTTIAAAITIPNLYYGALFSTNTSLVLLRNTVRRAGENCSPISQIWKLSKVRVICS